MNRLPALAVAVIGFVLYLFSSYPFPDWLDSPELITAAFRLGTFHPPGSPLAVVLGHLFSLWPFAPPATALLYFSAVFAACALYVLVRTIGDLFSALGPGDRRPGTATAAGLGAVFMLCGGLWSQAVRTEVYTLALFLVLGALREILLLSVEYEKKADRVIRAAAFTGMGLCVHPLMALSVAPGILVLIAWKKTRSFFLAPHQLRRSAVAFLLGMAPLLLIPLMVKNPIDLRFGDPTTLTGWLKTILGLTFSHSFTPSQSTGSLATTLLAVFSGMGLGLAVLAFLAAYPFFRRRPVPALLLVFTAAGSALTLALQKSVRLDNPDVSGYALPAMAALLLLASGGLAVAARTLSGLRPGLAWIAAALAALSLAGATLPADRSGCNAGRHLATQALESLPKGAVVLVADFNLLFALEYLTEVEGLRTDVDVFYLRDLDNARMRERLDPELEPLLPTAGSINRDSIRKLAKVRPVALDLGPHLDDSVLPLLHPHGLLWSTALPGSSTAVAAPVCQNGSADLRSADVVAWHFYWQARAAEKLGMPELCIARLNAARCASPFDQTIEAMAHHLELKSPNCHLIGPSDQGRPVGRSLGEGRPPLLPAVFLLLGLLAWGIPLFVGGLAWYHPAVSLAGFLCLELTLWLG